MRFSLQFQPPLLLTENPEINHHFQPAAKRTNLHIQIRDITPTVTTMRKPKPPCARIHRRPGAAAGVVAAGMMSPAARPKKPLPPPSLTAPLLTMQAVTRSTSGISSAHSRIACTSAAARRGTARAAAATVVDAVAAAVEVVKSSVSLPMTAIPPERAGTLWAANCRGAFPDLRGRQSVGWWAVRGIAARSKSNDYDYDHHFNFSALQHAPQYDHKKAITTSIL